mgnify:CR=1 FL=1
MADPPRFAPYAGLLLAVLAVSSSAVLVRLASAPAPVIATHRLLITVALILPFLTAPRRAQIAALSRRELGLCGLGGVLLAIHFLAWFQSLALTSVASSTVLVTLQPLFAFAGARVLFGERLPGRAVLAASVAMAGGVLIGWGDLRVAGSALLGDALALSAAAMIAGYFLVGQRVRPGIDVLPYTAVVYGTAAAVLLIATPLAGYPLWAYPARDWILFAAMAVGPTLLGHSVLNWCVRWLGASVIAVAILAEPVGASALAWVVLGEPPRLVHLAGGGVILLGIGAFMRYRR